MITVSKPNEPVKIQGVIVTLYGSPGARKSSLAMTAPNAVLYDFDAGIHRVSPEYRTDYIGNEHLRNWSDVVAFFNSPEALQFRSHVFDTTGQMINFIAEDLIRTNPKMRKADGGITQNGWGVIKQKMADFLASAKAKGINIIFVAHDRESKEDETTIIRPDIAGSSLGMIMKMSDLVGYVQVKNGKNVVCFSPTENYYGKNSCDLPPIMEIPDRKADPKRKFMEEILNLFRNNVNNMSHLNEAYNTLMQGFEQRIQSMTTPEDAVAISEDINAANHIWGSKLVLRGLFSEKLKELGLKYNTATSQFEAVAPKEQETNA